MTGSKTKYAAAVVIPAYAESEWLPKALSSLQESVVHFGDTDAFQVVVVVNEPLEVSREAKLDNQETLDILKGMKESLSYPLVVLGDRVWKLKKGVGEARKLGMDCAVQKMLKRDSDRVLSLDADCLVADNYVQTILEHPTNGSGFTIDFEHCPQTPEEKEGMTIYEDFLKWMKLGLESAGSPYGHFTIGSCLGTDVHHYQLCGGMPAKNATEDFHFMSKLRKVGPIDKLPTRVFPSCRSSNRVYLGTGFFMSKYQENKSKALESLFMPSKKSFEHLKEFLLQLSAYANDPEKIERCWKDCDKTSAFIHNQGFLAKVRKLNANSANEEQFQSRVHQLFDGIQTFRFLRFHQDS